MTTTLLPRVGLGLRPLAGVLLLATLAGCMQIRTARPNRPGGGRPSGGQTGGAPVGGQPVGSLPTYAPAPDARPVVVTGEVLDELVGVAPGEVVAFAYEGGRFRQIPVQVDERFVYDVGTVYEDLDPRECGLPQWCEGLTGHLPLLGYADPATHVGPDPDPALDEDDEVALMFMDFGGPADGHPRGVDPATGIELEAEAGGTTRYAYLYRRTDRGLDPAAGADYVRYDPRFERGPYLQSYDRGGGMLTGARVPLVRQHSAANPETTTASTSYYTVGFSDRWIMDRLQIQGGPDILDAYMFAVLPGDCRRTPFTGSETEGGFLVNKDGPVRAIRRVAGFNSGPLMESEWVFYQRYLDTRWSLRVHPLPSASWWIDHSAEAEGMLYRDANTAEWVPVNGRQDPVSSRPADWRMMTGEQGSYVVTYDVEASGIRLPPAETFYVDDASTSMATCLFDGAFYGASGLWLRGQLSNTDPRERRRGAAGEVALHRAFVLGGDPEAGLRALQSPVHVRVRAARGGA